MSDTAKPDPLRKQCPKCGRIYSSEAAWSVPKVCAHCPTAIPLIPYKPENAPEVGEFVGE